MLLSRSIPDSAIGSQDEVTYPSICTGLGDAVAAAGLHVTYLSARARALERHDVDREAAKLADHFQHMVDTGGIEG